MLCTDDFSMCHYVRFLQMESQMGAVFWYNQSMLELGLYAEFVLLIGYMRMSYSDAPELAAVPSTPVQGIRIITKTESYIIPLKIIRLC